VNKPLPFKLACYTKLELWRADTFWTKEPGTIAWLESLHPSDVLLDVGANIGLYSLYAAQRVKHVYAVEPHLVTVQTLIQNIQANNLQDKITVLQIGLGENAGYQPFHYNSLKAASSGSQIDQPISESGQAYVPLFTELKRVDTIDGLIKSGTIEHPTAIKIDVDGREPQILYGAMSCLVNPMLRTVQVEQHASSGYKIRNLMANCRFTAGLRHDTMNGQQLINDGADPSQVAHNQVFLKAA
jgi:FkbM family methyltransferase